MIENHKIEISVKNKPLWWVDSVCSTYDLELNLDCDNSILKISQKKQVIKNEEKLCLVRRRK